MAPPTHLAPSSALMCLYHLEAFGVEEEGAEDRAVYTARSSRDAWYLSILPLLRRGISLNSDQLPNLKSSTLISARKPQVCVAI